MITIVGVKLAPTNQNIPRWQQVICTYCDWRWSFSGISPGHGCPNR